MSTAAPRVMRGWLAAAVCTWMAFAAHAHAVPTVASLVVMVLITCVSAVVAMAMLGRKNSLLSLSLLVFGSQGLYHLALSVMTHHGSSLVAATGTGVHANHVMSLGVNPQAVQAESLDMLAAHMGAAVLTIFTLRQGERLARAVLEILSLSFVRRLLLLLRTAPAPWPRVTTNTREVPVLSGRHDHRLPLLRGPPSAVLTLA
ncbi:hypothetical protein ACF046_03510 [Glutamicibacter creatinolyticus]|uniref:hypothetical protein n=1 Tax=Glutamicibacter creatinolyticus TaxID=162496 RepID=UPI0033E86B3A